MTYSTEVAMCQKKDCNCFRIGHWQKAVPLGVCTTTTCRQSVTPPDTIDCYMAPGAVRSRCGQYWIPKDVSDDTLEAMASEYKARGIRTVPSAFGNRRVATAA